VPAGWALTPSGLAAGATFRLLFVTSTTHDATTSANIASWNTIVQTRAKAGHAGISDACGNLFKLVGSTTSVNARQNTDSESTDTDAAIYWLGDDKVADNYADFYDGSWDNSDDRGVYEDGSDTPVGRKFYSVIQDDGTSWPDGNNSSFGQTHTETGATYDNDALSDDDSGSAGVSYSPLPMSPVFRVPTPPPRVFWQALAFLVAENAGMVSSAISVNADLSQALTVNYSLASDATCEVDSPLQELIARTGRARFRAGNSEAECICQSDDKPDRRQHERQWRDHPGDS